MANQSANPLEFLKGSRLSSVEFVQDYVQLRFDGPTLTAITRPRVWVMNQPFEWGKEGYRDALCDRIGQMVRHGATIPEREIRIEFEDGSSLSISLIPEDYRAAEAVVFDNPPNPTVVW